MKQDTHKYSEILRINIYQELLVELITVNDISEFSEKSDFCQILAFLESYQTVFFLNNLTISLFDLRASFLT